MRHWIEQKWQQFGLWLFKDIMPPGDPLLLLRVTTAEAALRIGRCFGPTMVEAAKAIREYGEAVGEMEGALDAGED